MRALPYCFWLSVACVACAYAVYPLLMAAAAKIRSRPPQRRERFKGSVSVVVAARNEEAQIGRRVRELLSQISDAQVNGEVVVVSDGSTDATVSRAREVADATTRVLESTQHHGKAAALNQGCAASSADVIVFADARQTWEPHAMALLLENFADPRVGAAGGELILDKSTGAVQGVGLYWRFELWLRRAESAVHSTVGLSGPICAVRRSLFVPIPRGTTLDDIYWPMRVVMQGYRVVHDGRAIASDRLPRSAAGEMRRKVRTLSGNFQLVTRLPLALSPFHNAIWLQWISHKLLRLWVPWALILMLASSALLPGHFYRTACWAQVATYGLGLTGFRKGAGRFASAVSSFLLLNVAAWLAFWVWISGGSEWAWCKVGFADSIGRKELTECAP